MFLYGMPYFYMTCKHMAWRLSMQLDPASAMHGMKQTTVETVSQPEHKC